MNIKELKVNDIIIYKPNNRKFIILEINLALIEINLASILVKCIEEEEYTTYISSWILEKNFRHRTKLELALT